MIKILITEFLKQEALKNLHQDFKIIYKSEAWSDKDYLKKEIHNFDGIIVRNKTKLDKFLLEKALKLKFIGRLGVGLDNIDTEYCKNNNIFVFLSINCSISCNPSFFNNFDPTRVRFRNFFV